MPEFIRFFKTTADETPSCAIFMSGTGSNAINIIEDSLNNPNADYSVSVLVTDRPKSSSAKQIAEKYNIPLVAFGLKQFYTDHGLETTSIATEKGMELREKWTDELLNKLKGYQVDFGVLAGFQPLCNIMKAFPCLNIHPGDLIVTENGKRLYTGLHEIPIEKAILNGEEYLRSSVIIAEPLSQESDNVDSGYILGISDDVKIDFLGYALEELEAGFFARPEQKPVGGYDDALEEVAKFNLQKLKEQGDWLVFPKVVSDFVNQRFLHDGENQLYYNISKVMPISTVLYGKDFKELIFTLD